MTVCDLTKYVMLIASGKITVFNIGSSLEIKLKTYFYIFKDLNNNVATHYLCIIFIFCKWKIYTYITALSLQASI